ncbi:MAG TPA: prepilin-type N-terminal cleavage/methylation domain-containing protein [Vicinamibacteria bacterium]|nr:prepilin-type N-terminal cleavage/methylation domain-containing protein [Vicinamibacteria bacterium]
MAATREAPVRRPQGQDGFTLVEVLTAMVVLIFGLMAISNLFALATSSNVVARQMTAATAQAADVMDRLKSVPFAGLTPGGAADNTALSTAASAAHTWTDSQPIEVSAGTPTAVNTYEADRNITGLGTIRVRWQIQQIDQQTVFIHVVAASAPALLQARSQVDLTTFRSCTSPALSCPATP